MKTPSIKKNILLSTAYQILTLIIPFITAPYIARVIGPTGVGTYSFTNSIQMYFSLFAALGTASYGVREIARNRDDEKKRSKLFWEIELLSIFTGCICLIGWGILISFSGNYKIYYIILTMNLLNTILDISWFYTGLEQLKYTIVKNSIFKILGVILLFVFIKQPSDLALYIIIMTGTALAGTITMWLYLPKFIHKVKFKELKVFSHLKETLVYFIPTIATSIYTVLDKTLIGVITKDANENGYYEQASSVINMAKILTFTSLNTILGARISYLFAENKIREIKEKIEISMNYILFFGIGMMFGLLGVSNRFVPLFFGEGYEKTISIIYLLSPLVIIIGVSNCLGAQYYTPAGLRSKSAKYLIVGSCVNLVFNLLLIPYLSSIGASIATILAELTISILYLKNCNKFLTLNTILKHSWKKIIAAVIMLGYILGVGFINLNNMSILIIQVVGGIAIYMICLFVLKDQFLKTLLERYIYPRFKKIKTSD